MSELRTCAELEAAGFTTECVWSSCTYAGKCQKRCDPADPARFPAPSSEGES